MLKTLININKHFFNIFADASKIVSSPEFPSKMNDKMIFRKQKYDGRSKKRRWEERRTDKGETFCPPKKEKVDETIKNVVDKVKRRKFCMMLGYSGVDYYGMQRNPGTKTIEEDLLNALFKVGLIDDVCFNHVQNMQFQRAARTDKGVSAIRQIVSLKLAENLDLVKINAELPETIRVFGCKRVTKGFNSKSLCDGRTYTYLLPTVAFADREISQKGYRLDDDIFDKVNQLLQNYIGTKNFHNYTSKKKPNDPSASRHMKSFVCDKPFVKDDVEFAVLRVRGQSFMLHQIRKMVGCILAVVRGLTTVDTLINSFKMEKISIPRVPGLGLMLDYVHYDRYNYRYGEDGMHEKLTWEEVEEEVNEFKEKYIYPTIINTEINEESMLYWIRNKLSRHSYDDIGNESDEDEGGDDDDDKVNGEDEKICKNENVNP